MIRPTGPSLNLEHLPVAGEGSEQSDEMVVENTGAENQTAVIGDA